MKKIIIFAKGDVCGFKNKTHEQKVIFTVSIIFLILDVIIIFTDLFKGYKGTAYSHSVIIGAFLKLILLTIFNFSIELKKNLDNIYTSTPYLGFFYGMYLWIKKP